MTYPFIQLYFPMETKQPTTRQEAISELTIQTETYLDLAENIYCQNFPVSIRFDLKGTTAGQACYRSTGDYVRYNLTALDVEGGWDHLYNSTVPHEVAHIVQRRQYYFPQNRKQNPAHGKYWKQVMAEFGIPNPSRCHSLDLPSARKPQKRHNYSCPCGKDFPLSTTLHNKMNRGQVRMCRSCKGNIFLNRKEIETY